MTVELSKSRSSSNLILLQDVFLVYTFFNNSSHLLPSFFANSKKIYHNLEIEYDKGITYYRACSVEHRHLPKCIAHIFTSQQLLNVIFLQIAFGNSYSNQNTNIRYKKSNSKKLVINSPLVLYLPKVIYLFLFQMSNSN